MNDLVRLRAIAPDSFRQIAALRRGGFFNGWHGMIEGRAVELAAGYTADGSERMAVLEITGDAK